MTAFNDTAMTYDADGNVTNDGTNSYLWDARGHLSTLAGTNVAAYQYDAFGRRVQNTLNGLMTQYLYDGLNPVEELDGASPPNPTATMLTGLGIDEHFQRTDSSGTMSYLTDMLGSTMALADSSGALATTYTYEPFGNVTVNGADTNPYQFTGRENDATGLYYYRARYYSPTLQRFVSQDPLEFGSGDPNLYAYAGDSPAVWGDATGDCKGKDPCPKDKRRFFNWLTKPLAAMAADLNVPEPILFDLAASEGGWTDSALNHNMPLNNPFGMNNVSNGVASGNVHYLDLAAAITSWEDEWAGDVYGDQTPASFARDLENPAPPNSPYNSENPAWTPTFVGNYRWVLKWMKLCGIK